MNHALDDAINSTAEEIRAKYGYSRMGAHQVIDSVLGKMTAKGFCIVGRDDLKAQRHLLERDGIVAVKTWIDAIIAGDDTP